MLSNRFTRVALVGGAIAMAACAKEKTTTTDSAAGAMTPTDSSAMAPAAPAMTDANIVAYLDAANVADSAGGKVASTKGTDKDVQAFGKMMMGEHHALRVAGQDFAKKANITPEAPANDTFKTDADAFAKTAADTPKGAAWDKAYIDHEVTVHENVLKTADRKSVV